MIAAGRPSGKSWKRRKSSKYFIINLFFFVFVFCDNTKAFSPFHVEKRSLVDAFVYR